MEFQTNHLTEEQFAELLMGATPAPVQEHLKACAECAAEAERVAAAIGSFEQQSRLWAERRAAVRPALTAQIQRGGWAGIFARPQAWAAAALAVAMGAGIALSSHRQRPAEHTMAAVQDSAQDSAPPSAAPSPASGDDQTSQSEQALAAAARPILPANSHAAHLNPSKLKADNELLSAIDGELRADAAPPNLYGLDVSSHVVRSRSAERIAN